MYLVRGFLVWAIIIFAESIHGILRQMLLAPVVGDFPARRIAFFGGMILIFLIAYFFVGWINAQTTKSLFAVGLLWMILTALFEFGLGSFVLHHSPERILEDYDLSSGGLMGFGLLFMIFAPFLAARRRAVKLTN